jgi:hypothetical protein
MTVLIFELTAESVRPPAHCSQPLSPLRRPRPQGSVLSCPAIAISTFVRVELVAMLITVIMPFGNISNNNVTKLFVATHTDAAVVPLR